jgi:glycosyltransferase involved in cell wall biosynthesis
MANADSPLLSVIIPSYNEKINLERGVLDEVLAYLSKQTYSWELILSDDGSADGTTDMLAKFAAQHDQVRLIKNPHAGKGPAVTAGMLAAKGQWRLYTDFDQSTPIAEVEKLIAFTNTHQVIFGSRELKGARRDREPFYRHLMGRGFNLVVRILAVHGVSDTQCGFKMFSAAATETLFPKLYVYSGRAKEVAAFTGAFDVELLFLARKNGFKLKEVPILWRHFATTRVNPIKDSIRMFIDIVKIRFAMLGGKYR